MKIAFVPSYCLDHRAGDLSFLSEKSIREAASLYRREEVDKIVFSVAYVKSWEKERTLKMQFLQNLNVDTEQDVQVIGPIVDSFTEIRELERIINELKVKTITLVADSFHITRAKMILEAYFPQIEIQVHPFVTQYFRRTYEPHPIALLGWIKGWRTNWRFTWMLWNKFLTVLTPLMLKKEK